MINERATDERGISFKLRTTTKRILSSVWGRAKGGEERASECDTGKRWKRGRN